MSNHSINRLETSLSTIVSEIIKRNRGKRIVIEGSETYIYRLIREGLETPPDTHVEINLEPRFGACDIDIQHYLETRPDIVIHLGHNPFPNTYGGLRRLPFKIFFIPVVEGADPNLIEKVVRDAWENYLAGISSERIGLVYSVQYYRVAKIAMDMLLEMGMNLFIPRQPGMLSGQILGCTTRPLRQEGVDRFIVVSSGLFHALGVSLYTGLPTLLLDMHNGVVKDMYDATRRIRALISWNVYQARGYRRAAVVRIVDSHQPLIGGLTTIEKLLRSRGLAYRVYTASRLSEDIIARIPEDELVIVAGCPRISTDDLTRFGRPVLNLEQLLIVMDEKDFNDVYPPPRRWSR